MGHAKGPQNLSPGCNPRDPHPPRAIRPVRGGRVSDLRRNFSFATRTRIAAPANLRSVKLQPAKFDGGATAAKSPAIDRRTLLWPGKALVQRRTLSCARNSRPQTVDRLALPRAGAQAHTQFLRVLRVSS